MSEKITFKELVEQIARQSSQSRSSTTHFIHELVRIIEKGLKESGSVSISGFGKFELLQSESRQQAHPVTGEMVTVAGRKRVVFKPSKDFREGVNHPFAGLAGRVLEKAAEKFDADDAEDSGLPHDEAREVSESSSASADEPVSTQKSGDKSRDSLDGLLIEHDNPQFTPSPSAPEMMASGTAAAGSGKASLGEDPDTGKPGSQTAGRQEPVTRLGYEDEPGKTDSRKEQPRGVTPEEQTLASEVQKSGSLNWTYTAAVIIALLIFIILFVMYQQNREASESVTESLPDMQSQIEQTETLPPASDAAPPDQGAASETAAAGESDTGAADSGDPGAQSGVQGSGETASEGGAAGAGTTSSDGSAAAGTTAGQGSDSQTGPPATAQSEFETESFTVEPGQSLWTIADTHLGNPYLWPVLYYLNQHNMENPNFLPADADIILPTISDPENLNEFEREQVAQGYFKLYEWNVQYNPEEARYFLWAVGVFSPSLLDHPPSDVLQEDLDFARNR